MEDQFNILGISNLILAFCTLIIICKKFSLVSYLTLGWVGLFTYSLPVFLNFNRKIFYTDLDYSYLVKPSLESKMIYFTFWIGFFIYLTICKEEKKFLKESKNVSLSTFEKICEINLFFYIIYFFFYRNLNVYILMLGSWFLVFTTIIAFCKQYG